MSYAGVQMFMEKLNQLINCNDIPIFNNPSIISERPQFQVLYDELGTMIQTLYIDQHQDLEKLNNLKRRFTDAAEKAQQIVDLFLYRVHKKVHQSAANSSTSNDFNPFLNLDSVRVSLKFIKEKFKSMKMDLSPTPERPLNQSAAPVSIPRNAEKLSDAIFVGIDRDAELIRDKLVEDQKKLDVVSIVGMGGIGKTTLATKVFKDGYIKHHFYVRVWVTVSQKYDKRDVLIQILESVRAQLDLEKTNDSRLREMVHKHLMGKRYLIVIDDIWHKETWDNLKVFFPHDNTGSRILLTSRLTKVAKHASSDGLVHHLGYLNKERSWELLRRNVFQVEECPAWSIKPGMQIVEHCQGLPLAVVVMAGVLAKHARSKSFWEEIAERTGSYIVGDQNRCMETLALSYDHLPLHLRECFLYLGGFPEDYMFKVQRLIWLWVAEGFIQQDGNRSLDDIAEGFLMDLIDRNLVIVAHKSKFNGAVKACKVHDLVRELCLRKAKDERFILIKERRKLSAQFSGVITRSYKPARMLINEDINILDFPSQNLRSILCFGALKSLSNAIVNGFHSFVLLRVLDLRKCKLDDFPKGVELLLNLRYLAIWISSPGFPSSICNLWSLQTLIYITGNPITMVLPSNVSDLVNLRHLRSYYLSTESLKLNFSLASIEKPMNLQTISSVTLGNGVEIQKCFPYIKELACESYFDRVINFSSLAYLEKLELSNRRLTCIRLPATMKSLTLRQCYLPWSEMLIIQSLPNLQVLKLHMNAFIGNCWNTNKHEFPQLKFLRLKYLDIQVWEAYSRSFPCLRRLEIDSCRHLEDIPLEIGDIPTLELIKVDKYYMRSVGKSVRRIQEQQHVLGNYDLKIDIQEAR